ncbi:hypothetical protein [Lonsdalea quercina]|uniref:hypothetical protein n=1 Tax=Lonsdalea quercina TaxID=71657 RepID=UPI003974FDED
MIKKVVFAAIVIFSSSVSAKTMKDFFSEHPALYENIYTRQAIKEQADGLAALDAMGEDTSLTSLSKKQSQLIRDEGYNYADLALRDLVTYCDDQDLATLHRLREKECEILASESDK